MIDAAKLVVRDQLKMPINEENKSKTLIYSFCSIDDDLMISSSYLQEIAYVDDECSRCRCNVDPLVVMEDLEAANSVLQ